MKRALFSLCVAAIVIFAIEVLSYFTYGAVFGTYKAPLIDRAKSEAQRAIADSGVFVPQGASDAQVIRQPVLHPYLGFTVAELEVADACLDRESALDDPQCVSRKLGAVDRQLVQRNAETAVVAILGGSFADGVARGGSREYLTHVMRYLDAFEGKNVVVYNLAMGTYKQPQQLMQLSYYLALGAKFDVVINLDGFNEMAAGLYGWRDSALHPVYPKSWNYRVGGQPNRAVLKVYADRFSRQEQRAALARISQHASLQWSRSVNLIWTVLDNYLAHKLATLERALELVSRQSGSRDLALETLGPHIEFEGLTQTAEYIGHVWMNSSLALRNLAEGHGARYYHFLQPNQYIEGSKPLSEEERKIAILEKGGYGNAYRQYQPILVRRGQQLRALGVHFYDLTFMFKEMNETLYVDNCCHLNPKGYDEVARQLMVTIKGDWYSLHHE